MRLVFYHCATNELRWAIFSLFPLPGVGTGVEPLTLGWWVKFSTAVLTISCFWNIFFFPDANNSGWALTPILRMMRLVFYHCYTNQLVLGYFYLLVLVAVAGLKPYTSGMMRLVFYHCATNELHWAILYLPLLVVAAGVEPLTLGWWVKFTTSVLTSSCFWSIFFFPDASDSGWALTPILRMMRLVFYRRYNNQLVLGYFLSLGASYSSWALTLNLRMMGQFFYHCATAAPFLYRILEFSILIFFIICS
jgi:hypothetical protein